MRGWIVFAWAAVATVVLVVAGIFGSLVVSGRIVLFPEAVPTAAPTPEITPVVDTSYTLIVLNATGQSGLASEVKDGLVEQGWSADKIFPGQAGSSDFPETTVYYPAEADEAAALGLADLVGGANVVLSDAYLQAGDPHQLALVIGLDYLSPPAPTATP